jgi:hypothetical protein
MGKNCNKKEEVKGKGTSFEVFKDKYNISRSVDEVTLKNIPQDYCRIIEWFGKFQQAKRGFP